MHNNVIDNMCSIINQFDNNIAQLNTKLFFEKQRIQNKLTKKKKEISKDAANFKVNSCESFDCILENLSQKRIFNNNLISPSNECIEMRFKMYNKISKMKIDIKPNLSNQQLHNMKKFLNIKPFAIIQCDKNIGLSIISNKLLDSLCIQHLCDETTYSELTINPLKHVMLELNNNLNDLIVNRQLNISIKKLLPLRPKLGKFRILAKLHKDKFGIRPIINNTNHPTSQLCKLVDMIIQPILRNTETFIKDSQHLLQKCNKLVIENSEVYLYSMDFESLYTNIIKSIAVNYITDFLKDTLDENYITPFAFHKVLSLVFEKNIFTYNNKKFFKQIKGLAMGCICGPSVASLFVYILESKWLIIHKPLFYVRFIDDINLITYKKIDEFDFKTYFLNLKLNITEDKTINFLDLSISFDNLTRKLNFSLYVKPTNTFSYLQVESNHPKFIFKNIPKSLLIRIRRICTKYTDYLYFARKLIVQLLSRGYKFNELFSLAITIGKIERESLLPYKEKSKFIKSEKLIYFGTEFNKSVANFNKEVSDSFNTIFKNHNLFYDYKLRLYNSMANNINTIFVHNNKMNFFKNTISCFKANCSTCKFVCSNYYVYLKNNFVIPIQSKASCNSSNIVYIIRCSLCQEFYIGQSSKNARIRINQHIRSIMNFKPYVNYTSEVGHHFNLKGHNFKRDFQYFVFKDNISDKHSRLSIENDLIHIVQQFNPPIINRFIPSIHKLNTLAFYNK